MTNETLYLLSGSMGVLLQIVLKIKSLKVRAKATNMKFVFKKYLGDDWPTIAGSFLTVILLLLVLPEIVELKPETAKLVKILFAFVGYTGSSIVQLFFSATSKKILNIIDLKTNIADDVVPPVTKENKEAVHEVSKGDTTD